MQGKFIWGHDHGLMKPGQVKGVSDVIVVRVGTEDEIAWNRGRIHRAVGIFPKIGIKHHSCSFGLEQKARMTEVSQAHASGQKQSTGVSR
jgi:hypothetical protein